MEPDRHGHPATLKKEVRRKSEKGGEKGTAS